MKYILTLLLLALSIFAQNTREYYVSGKLHMEGNVSDHGQKIGTWNEFYENGRLRSTTQYRYGQVVSIIYYTMKGALSREFKYDTDGHISYDNNAGRITEYVEGLVRYIDGVSQWNYGCDSIAHNNVKQTLCGYTTLLGSRVGFWSIKLDKEDDLIESAHRYAVYDTTRSTTLLYLKEEICSKMAGCMIGITESNKSVLYALNANTNKYEFNSSISWNNDFTYFYTSLAPSKHSGDDCNMSDNVMKLTNTTKYNCITLKRSAKTLYDLFNLYK